MKFKKEYARNEAATRILQTSLTDRNLQIGPDLAEIHLNNLWRANTSVMETLSERSNRFIDGLIPAKGNIDKNYFVNPAWEITHIHKIITSQSPERSEYFGNYDNLIKALLAISHNLGVIESYDKEGEGKRYGKKVFDNPYTLDSAKKMRGDFVEFCRDIEKMRRNLYSSPAFNRLYFLALHVKQLLDRMLLIETSDRSNIEEIAEQVHHTSVTSRKLITHCLSNNIPLPAELSWELERTFDETTHRSQQADTTQLH